MSESITHTAVVDDCLNFVLNQSEEFSGAFFEAAEKLRPFAQLGGITRHGDKHNPMLLEKLREQYKNGEFDDHCLSKLAFVIGWMSHRAADRQFKRIFRSVDPDCEFRPTNCSVYHDAYLFGVSYDNGNTSPYTPAILNPGMEPDENTKLVNVETVEKLFDQMWIRMLIQMHTFIPDDDDIEPWLDNVCSKRQKIYVDLNRYAAAYANPDKDMYKRFITDINFYDANDKLLEIAEILRQDINQNKFELDEPQKVATEQSQYAQALSRAFKYVRAANSFFKYEISMEELVEILDIGKPELSKV
ncbi:MAG: hypothetical protein PF692_00245 [Kiritimatiellae bacterium]|jgi:hypothetical protein|nr:hypothetical protein [Kiritimatiellia bacterium]